LTFQYLPTRNQPQPKFLVAGSPRGGSKAAALISPPLKLIYTGHVTPLGKRGINSIEAGQLSVPNSPRSLA
jgi:hypothetical protein